MSAPWLDDVLAEAERQLPAPVWKYAMAAAGEGATAADNEAAWRAVRFLPRVLRDVRRLDFATELHGDRYQHPFGIAPTSLQRCVHPDGELAMARAAAASGVPHVVSSNAGHRFAEIDAIGAPWWLQLYVTQDREDCLHVVDAAVAAGARALVLTVDTPFPGTKHDVSDSDFADIDLSWHRINYEGQATASQRGQWAADLDAVDVTWLADRSGLPVIVKGVLHPADAEHCLEAGAAAIWVSNHGGRQLDRSVATARALPAVAAAVGGRAPVYVDGGVRSGLDVLAGLALGADAVFLGRLPLLALGAGGEASVCGALAAIEREFAESARLAGVRNTSETHEIWLKTRPSGL